MFDCDTLWLQKRSNDASCLHMESKCYKSIVPLQSMPRSLSCQVRNNNNPCWDSLQSKCLKAKFFFSNYSILQADYSTHKHSSQWGFNVLWGDSLQWENVFAISMPRPIYRPSTWICQIFPYVAMTKRSLDQMDGDHWVKWTA